MAQYGISKQVDMDFEKVIDKVTSKLKEQGFGILTTINVQKAMKEKLGVDYDKYMILGACNPPFAHKALEAEKEIGLLLPCNVVVYEKEGKVHISAIKPTVAMAMVDNENLAVIAKEVEEKLETVIREL